MSDENKPDDPTALAAHIAPAPTGTWEDFAKARMNAALRHPKMAPSMFACRLAENTTIPQPLQFGVTSYVNLSRIDRSIETSFRIMHEMMHFLLDTEGRCRKHRSFDFDKNGRPVQLEADRDLFWAGGCLAINTYLVHMWRDVLQADGLRLEIGLDLVTPEALGFAPGLSHEQYYELLRSKAPPQSKMPPCGRQRIQDASEEGKLRAEAARAAAARQLAQSSMPGSHPGADILSFIAKYQPEIDFWSHLRQIASAAYRAGGRASKTYTRFARRQGGLGFGVRDPRLVGRRSKTYDPVAMIVDVSGSVFEDLRSRFASEVDALTEAGVEIYLVVADAEVQNAGFVRTLAQAVPMIKGNGGTDFTPAFAHLAALEEQGERFSHCFVLTDGDAIVPGANPLNAPTTWVLPTNGHVPATWGAVERFKSV